MTRTLSVVDPNWWTVGEFDGRSLQQILAERDIGTLFLFLSRRGCSRSSIANATGLTENAVRQCWQGRRKVLQYDVLERIADGLRIPRGMMGLAYAHGSGVETTQVTAGSPMPLDDDWIGLVAGIAVGTGPGDRHVGNPVIAARLPAVVTMHDIEMLREMTRFHRIYDAQFGGGACRDSASAYLSWAMGMLRVRCASEAVSRALLSALSDLHQVVGWACHDLGEHDSARPILINALSLAKKAEDLPLVAGALYRLGRVSMHQRRAGEALRMWQLGQIAAQDSGCLISVAVLHSNAAWAYAQLGDDLRVRDALARAESERQRAKGTHVPGWARFFTMPADLTGMSGLVFSTLAVHEQHRSQYAPLALAAFETSLHGRRPEEGRSRVLDMIGLSGAQLLDHQFDQARRSGMLAVEATASITSQRAVDRLRDVVDLANRFGVSERFMGLSDRVESLATRSN